MAMVLGAATLACAISRATSLMFTIFRREKVSQVVRLPHSQMGAVTEALTGSHGFHTDALA